jgi:hypothetical protein
LLGRTDAQTALFRYLTLAQAKMNLDTERVGTKQKLESLLTDVDLNWGPQNKQKPLKV